MAVSADWKFLLYVWTSLLNIGGVEVLQICTDGYLCHEGHCCGRGRCCTSYYDIWWVWLIWIVLGLLGICCFYHHKRMRDLHEESCQRRHGQHRNRSSQNRTTASSGNSSEMLCNAEKIFYLPSYEDIVDQPKEPPEYSQITPSSALPLNAEYQTSGDQSDILAPPATGGPPTYSTENLTSLLATRVSLQDTNPTLPADVQATLYECTSSQGSDQSKMTAMNASSVELYEQEESLTARLLQKEEGDG